MVVDQRWGYLGRKELLALPATFKQPFNKSPDRTEAKTYARAYLTEGAPPHTVVEDAGFQHRIKVLKSLCSNNINT